jgi:hypothetical protein
LSGEKKIAFRACHLSRGFDFKELITSSEGGLEKCLLETFSPVRLSMPMDGGEENIFNAKIRLQWRPT